MYIITGMHRSGTSLVARLFCESGADMGDPAHFYRPDRWNPEGYYEQPEIHAVNMPLINGPWGRLAYLRLPTTNTILRRAARRRDQIRETAAKYDGKIVKETRFCLTLPAWLACGARVEKILVCLRDPIAAVESIRKRNAISLRRAYSLWLVHHQRLFDSVGDISLWFIYYGNLLDEKKFGGEIVPALRFFGTDVRPELESLRSRTVRTHMDHSPDNAVTYPPQIECVWRKLLDRHTDQFRSAPDRVEAAHLP